MAIINKIKKSSYFVIVFVLIGVFCYFLFFSNNNPSKKIEDSIAYIKIGGQILKVELAETPEKQIKGLSGRENLKENEGMLFIFAEPRINYFWMKEMKFPIDIIWLDENFRVIYIEKSVLPESYPKSFGPDQKSKYVLEIWAGFVEKNNLKENDQVKFLP